MARVSMTPAELEQAVEKVRRGFGEVQYERHLHGWRGLIHLPRLACALSLWPQ
ncbi:hypothetical protein GTH01_20640 [Gluconobacter thailandicus F149-1 = NBRC 100600]|nr:hypothetical protein GTH01_20640 [Gluconobacter thailandicus F149-1 = NBRC 100600]